MSNVERRVQNVEVGNHLIELLTLSAKVLILACLPQAGYCLSLISWFLHLASRSVLILDTSDLILKKHPAETGH